MASASAGAGISVLRVDVCPGCGSGGGLLGLALRLLLGQLVEDGLLDGGLDLRIVACPHELGDRVARLLGGGLGLVGLDVAVAVRVGVTRQEGAGLGGLALGLLLLGRDLRGALRGRGGAPRRRSRPGSACR